MCDPNEETARPHFELGRVVITANLQARLRSANPELWEAELRGLISRHASGNCGGVWQAGLQQVVAIMGSALSENQTDLIVASVGPNGKIALLLDQDNAGRAGQSQCLDELSSRVFVKALGLPNEGDQPDFLNTEQIRRVIAG